VEKQIDYFEIYNELWILIFRKKWD